MYLRNANLNEQIYTKKLKSNFEMFIMNKKGFKKKYAVLAVDYGSNDLEYINPHTKKHMVLNHGIAHFLEHKMFEMPDGSDAFTEFSKYGANANAFTNFNMTAYLFSATENFEKCLEHLIHFVQTPYFTDKNVEKEKGIIGQEIRMYDDDPSWQLFFSSLNAMYKDHPVSIDIAGTADTIAKITKEELYDCYSTFYSPSNMALFVIGDVDIENTANLIENTVKDDNMFEGRLQRIEVNETDEIRSKKTEKTLEISTPMLNISYKEKSASLKKFSDQLKKTVLVDIISELAFGMTSEINNCLYEQRLIYGSLNIGSCVRPDYGYISIDTESEEPEKVLETVNQKISELKQNGFSQEDFERVKKQKLGEYIKLYDSTTSFANLYLSMHFTGMDLLKYYDVMQNATLEEANEFAREYFDEKMQTLSIIRPKQ